jgi:hypothetical protein
MKLAPRQAERQPKHTTKKFEQTSMKAAKNKTTRRRGDRVQNGRIVKLVGTEQTKGKNLREARKKNEKNSERGCRGPSGPIYGMLS